jgi:hypothetical protein
MPAGSLPLDQESRTAAEQLDSMRETGRHHRPACGDRLNQDPEVTCSIESYGSRTRFAALMRWLRAAAGRNRASKCTRSATSRARARASSDRR